MGSGADDSLKHKIECLQSHPLLESILPIAELKLFHDELSELQSISPPQSSSESVDPTGKDAMLKIGDLIVSFLSDRSRSRSESSVDGSFTLALRQQLRKIRHEIRFFTKTLAMEEDEEEEDKSEENDEDEEEDESEENDEDEEEDESGEKEEAEEDKEEDREDQRQRRLRNSVYSRTLAEEIGGKKKIVGLDKQLFRIQEFVFGGTSEDTLALVVVGMAGIGKTTLVKQVYYDSFIRQHFDDYLFLPIGPRYQLKEILLLALKQLGFDPEKIHEEDDEIVLGQYVYKSLDSRYLIVLDDVWDTSVEELLRVFPSRKQSNIILTSRQLDFRFDFPTWPHTIRVPFLDDDQSWNLLRETVFNSEEQCHRQLERIGREIATKCEGLPLAIIQVAELLCEIGKTVEAWREIAENEDPLIIRSEDNTPLSKALYLSYTMLPLHLKVCFLYMGVFPKKYKLPRRKLIELWVSECVLEPREGVSLEEVADACLEELISRSVVLKMELRSIDMSKCKTCRLHFTFRNVCVSEAKSERIFPIIKTYSDSLPEDMDSQQRLCFHNNVVLSIREVRMCMESVPDARSLLCFGPMQQYPVVLYLGFRLLKVLEVLAIRFYEFPQQISELVDLRYLAITCDEKLPPFISSLSNLEVLIIHRHHSIKTPNFPVYLPMVIWNLLELKHLQCMGFDLPEPPADDALILRKLSTLSGISSHSCTLRVLARMPDLMKLGILIESAHDAVETLSFLGDFAALYEEFSSFKFVVVNPNLQRSSQVVPPILKFPINIRKITLSGCGLPWKRMTAIAALPNLIVLKLRWYAFCGPEWEIGARGFAKLRFLVLEDLDLQCWKWRTDNGYFAGRLEGLIVRHCYKLRKIPTRVQGTLAIIEADDCSPFLTHWAREIRDSRSKDRYEDHNVKVHSSWED